MNGQIIKEEHVDALKAFLEVAKNDIYATFEEGTNARKAIDGFKEEYPNLFQ